MALVVVAGPATEVVSVQTMREHSRIIGTGDDALLAAYIKAARREAEHITEQLFGEQTLRLTMSAFPANELELPRPPIVSVTSVKYRDEAGAWQTLSPVAYDVDLLGEPPAIRPLTAWPSVWAKGGTTVAVNYQAGHVVCPDEVNAYICVRAASLYEHREADGEKPAIPHAFAERLLDRARRWHS